MKEQPQLLPFDVEGQQLYLNPSWMDELLTLSLTDQAEINGFIAFLTNDTPFGDS